MEYISVKAASEKWGVTPRWIQKLCEAGKLPGAKKLQGSGVWMIPADAVVTADRKNHAQKPQTNTYTPSPIDTSAVHLPETLLELTEKIAENVHENWSAGRIAEGWTYGEKRDDNKKTTPCLVPYDQLSESEKAYDRNTALETLKLIVALGYRIEKE